MLNKVQNFMKRYAMLSPGDTLTCAVSGGADSMALLFAMYLLAPKMAVTLKAAHFNHGLRGEESDRDAAFVKDFCRRYDIPLFAAGANVQAGKKGLEASAREARYAFLQTLPGKIATAHTANDNAETVLMHIIRGTGLKGLGGIMPVNGNVIRPMLTVTREEVIAFLEEYHIPYITDSSNNTDQFLRNRLRHHVMPLLVAENPNLAENVSAMAIRLRQDEEALAEDVRNKDIYCVSALREMKPAIRSRALAKLLEDGGVKEPEADHIALAEKVVLSQKPSAKADFQDGITLQRSYDTLSVCKRTEAPVTTELSCPGSVTFGDYRITANFGQNISSSAESFAVKPKGKMIVRSRQSGDKIRLPGGTKSLKKLYIDKKIPEHLRSRIPVIADDLGVLGAQGFGPNLERITRDADGIVLCIEKK